MFMVTELPFSTSGGSSSLIRPGLTADAPTTWRIADFIVSGVARAGRTISAAPAAARKVRRFACASISVLKRRQVGHHVLDLLGGEYRFATIVRGHADQAVDPIIGRH